MQCVLLLGYFVFWFEVRVRTLVGWLLALEILIVLLAGTHLTSSALHLMGAGAGFAIAIWMVKTKRVDCENWDVFSVWTGRNRMTREERAQAEANDPQQQNLREERLASHRAVGLNQIREMIRSGSPLAALQVHRRLSRDLPAWTLPEPELRELIMAFHKQQLWAESIPVMGEYVKRYPQTAAQVRLKLAQILVAAERRPAQALKVMAKIDEEALDGTQREFLARLRAKAAQCHEADPYEIADDDW
jgi:hypothetical protein